MKGQVLLWKVKASMSMDRTQAEHSWLRASRTKNGAKVAEVLGGIPSMRARWGRGPLFQLHISPPRLCPLPNSRCLPCLLTPLPLSVGLVTAFEVLTHLHFLCIWACLSLFGGSRWSGHPWRRNVPPEGFGLEPLQDRVFKWECDKRFLGSFLIDDIDIQCCANYCHSKVIQWNIYIHSVILYSLHYCYYRILNRIPWVIQKDLAVYPFYM